MLNKLNEQEDTEKATLLWEKMQEKERNSIVMTTEKSEESQFLMGESKIGGAPHLPKDFAWPDFNGKPLAFLAQINLEETAKHDAQGFLPESGILYFFHEGGENVWGFDPKDKGGFCVKYHTGCASDLVLTELPQALEDYLRFSPCKLTFSRKASYPSVQDDEGIVNKLLGYPDLVQGDIFLEAQLVTNRLYCGDPTGYNDPRAKELEKSASEWMLLFQIDSDDNADMMWGDVGRIYFTIKKNDLEKLNFDAIWSSFQCC